jgi:hypothetical protein
MRINAPHFHQLDGQLAPMQSGCDDLWDQDDREALAWAVSQAEQMIEEELGTFLVPTQVTGEEIRMARTRRDWWNAEFATRYKKVSAFGTRALTLLQADAPVTYSDEDGDPLGREETATVGQPGIYGYLPGCDDECDVAVYFRVADGAWDAANPWFEIRNLRADIDSSSVMYLTGESAMFVRPALWGLREVDCAGADDWRWPFLTTNLVDYVDVYCRSVSLGTPVTLHWEGMCDCASPCAHSTQGACAYVTDWDRGHFAPRAATWGGTAHVEATPTYSVVPVKMTVDYVAGWPLDAVRCRMDSRLERAVVKLANALLPEPPCGYCDAAKVLWERDREAVDPLTPEAAGLPWDIYSKGALEAWRIVKRMAEGRGGHVRG